MCTHRKLCLDVSHGGLRSAVTSLKFLVSSEQVASCFHSALGPEDHRLVLPHHRSPLL